MYSLVMKKKKDNMPATFQDVADIVKQSQEELALMFGRALKDSEERLNAKISLSENNLRNELGGKIDTINTKLN
jgi:hypothetical protein